MSYYKNNLMKKMLLIPLVFISIAGYTQYSEKDINVPTTVIDESEKDKVFTKVDKIPEYPDGNQGLYTYLSNAIEYPRSAIKDNVSGVVYVQFIVRKTGKIDAVKVTRGIREDLDQAAIDVVRKMKDWKPGEVKGEKVDVYLTVPIRFYIN